MAPAPTPVPSSPAPTPVPLVAQPPIFPAQPPTPANPVRMLTPFPSLRVAGRLNARGAVFRLVKLSAPRESKVVTVCKGRGCSGVRRTMRGGKLRLRHLQRSYRAGAVFEIRVTRRGYVGKYTRILVRRNRAPLRRDLCLLPGSSAPRQCPS